MATKWIILSGMFFSLFAVSPAVSQEKPKNRDCIACGVSAESGMHIERFKGRRVAACPGECREHWKANPNQFFLKLQSRGALFDENSIPDSKENNGWLYLGMYVLVGLIFGAICAYVAVTQGHEATGWFLAGLVLNVIGLIAILVKGQGDLSKYPAGVPVGFAKVPSTYTPAVCQACGRGNHPSASICSQCGAEQKSTVETEVLKLS